MGDARTTGLDGAEDMRGALTGDGADATGARGAEDMRGALMGDGEEDTHGAEDARGSAALDARPYVIFDFDGTLADTTAAIIAAARVALTEYGMDEKQMGDLRRLIGPPFPQGYSMVYGMSESDALRVCTRYRHLYRAMGPRGHQLFPGMHELLKDLRAQGRRLAIASSKMEYMVNRMLDDNGVTDLFDVVSAQTDAAHSGKPYLISHALEMLGTTADQAVMVGDRNYDIAGAAQVGVPAVGVLFGTAPRAELKQAGAAAIVQTVQELRGVLMGE